jgi:hypothetical protein
MIPNFKIWPFEHLVSVKSDLERIIKKGDRFQNELEAVLRAVNQESDNRKYILWGFISGRKFKELGRWSSEAKCKEQAKEMDLPVGEPRIFQGIEFLTKIEHLP